MFYENIGAPVRSSTKYFVALGLVILLVGMGYSVYLFKKANSPIVPEGMASQQQQNAPQAQGCTSASPCTPTVQSNGSTEVVQGKSGFGICFDSSYWVNLPRLGYRITYGGVEKKYECTREDVLAGTCDQMSFDAFRFVPEAGVSLPQYWFATKGTNC